MLNRLSTQTGLLFFLGMGLVLGLFSWFQYAEKAAELPAHAEAEAYEFTRLIASSVNNNVLYRKPFPLWKQMMQMQNSFARDEIALTRFAIVDVEQLVLTHSDPLAHPVMKKIELPAVGLQWSGHTIQVTEDIQHPSDGHVIGHISLSFDASSVARELAAFQRKIVVVIGCALLISILLAIGMSRRVSAPLRALASLSTRIGDGDIDISAFSGKPDEIRGLARAIHQADLAIATKARELAHSQSLLNAVLKHSPAVIFIKDIDGKYLLINARYEALYHISNEAIHGKTDDCLFDADKAGELRRHDLQVIAGGKAMVIEEAVPDERGLRHYYVLKFPLYDAGNHIYAVCGIATDITEQKQATAEMTKLATVIDQTDEMVMITDRQGVIEYVNPAFERISGFAADEVLGQTPRIVKSGHYPEAYYAAMWQTINAGKTWHGDFTNQNKDGDLYEVTQSITPILDEYGEITGFSSVQRDVTQQRKMQLKVQHSDRVESLGVLAGGIAHDFNNLLTAILGNAALAHKKLEPASPALRYLESIEHASHSAADLCKQMLAYSGRGKFVVKPVNLSELVADMGKLIDVSLARNVVLKYHLSEQLPAIDADVAQMQQIALNLITNASEAIEGKSGVVSLSTGVMQADADYLHGCIGDEHLQTGRYVYLEVSDTGCGMDVDTQKKIFDPFFTTKFTGRGLGMSAMLGIVKGHHGGLRIYSEPGEGSAIKVVFPLSPESAVETGPQSSDSPLWRSSGTVLVVDDEETIREVASAMLEDIGFDVLTASDGVEGVEVFRQYQNSITLVLLDMTMPRMDGEACFGELRRIRTNVQVLLSSGYNEQDATDRFAGKGLAGFIQKPYTPDMLREKIQGILTSGDAPA